MLRYWSLFNRTLSVCMDLQCRPISPTYSKSSTYEPSSCKLSKVWTCPCMPAVVLYLCIFLPAAAAKSLQSCPTLCDPIDGSPPGSPIPGILQARTLEWVAISFSNAWKWKVKVKSLSRVWPSVTPWAEPTRLLHPWDFPGKSTGVGCHCLLRSRP